MSSQRESMSLSPGWYPTQDGGKVYWDGNEWTERKEARPPALAGVPAWLWITIIAGLLAMLAFVTFWLATVNSQSEARETGAFVEGLTHQDGFLDACEEYRPIKGASKRWALEPVPSRLSDIQSEIEDAVNSDLNRLCP